MTARDLVDIVGKSVLTGAIAYSVYLAGVKLNESFPIMNISENLSNKEILTYSVGLAAGSAVVSSVIKIYNKF
jgi:hypothetical protein